ncbi:MAG TPA: histidinol-phosphate transaminase [Bacteroidia bacterium]|nr:histidinol-phosphate transaminase [Bacteroidia bacterium]
MFDLNIILRENIKKLVPYSTARDEYKGAKGIFLDANENSFGSPIDDITENVNRYPDPLQTELKAKISKTKGVPAENIFVGNGSDEAIDILFRAFCNPGQDKVIVCPPTYGMYEVSAGINDVQVLKVNLTPEVFQLDTEKILAAIDKNVKLIFICCPNNPTGNGVKWNDVKLLLEKFPGIVVIDEAYINFASYRSLITELPNFPNLIILQTLSKAWGMAGLRIGMAFASIQIIDVFNKIKPPYNINVVSQHLASEALDNIELVNNSIKQIVQEREKLAEDLKKYSFIKKIYKSEANFILIKTDNPKDLYNYLLQNQIIVRDRSKAPLCEGCLRITVGTQEENKKLINALNQFK